MCEPAEPGLRAAYGLRIRSEIPLPDLAQFPPAANGAPEIIVRRAPVDIAMPPAGELRRVEIAPDAIRIAWRELARVAIVGGDLIEVDALDGHEPSALALALTGPVLAALLHRRGRLVLHAAALAPGGDRPGFLIAGDNGAGKSTLAAACVQAGFALFNDDVAAVDTSGGAARLLPGPPTIKLSHAALARLDRFPGTVLPGTPAHAAKLRIRVDRPAPAPAPVARLYILHRATRLAIEPLGHAAGLAAILRHAYMLKFGAEALAGVDGARHFRQSAALANAAPVSLLHVPDDLAAVDAVVDAIRAELDGAV